LIREGLENDLDYKESIEQMIQYYKEQTDGSHTFICVLLQRLASDSGYAFPGGHVSFGETNEQTLIREFWEELAADITVNGLRWVGEIFFGEASSAIKSLDRSFFAVDEWGNEKIELEFSWIATDRIAELELYPVNAKDLLKDYSSEVKHFVYEE